MSHKSNSETIQRTHIALSTVAGVEILCEFAGSQCCEELLTSIFDPEDSEFSLIKQDVFFFQQAFLLLNQEAMGQHQEGKSEEEICTYLQSSPNFEKALEKARQEKQFTA